MVREQISWVGSQKAFVDEIDVRQIGRIYVGRFGGCSTAGQYKNEDGCLIWIGNDWDVGMVLDAHKTAQSADLILKEFDKNRGKIEAVLEKEVGKAIGELQPLIVSIFQEETFKKKCRNAEGETACLLVIRKEKYVWWFSVGDCVLYLLHPELEALGESVQNHRSFYEWIGEVNTFDAKVPCYSTGTKELRQGKNRFLLTTDGLIECPDANFQFPSEVVARMHGKSVRSGIQQLLTEIREKGVRDSTTILSWEIEVEEEATLPSDG
ncbi:MAG: protein phosphatase 2C domain-containing protein [Anaerobacillus sp.]